MIVIVIVHIVRVIVIVIVHIVRVIVIVIIMIDTIGGRRSARGGAEARLVNGAMRGGICI